MKKFLGVFIISMLICILLTYSCYSCEKIKFEPKGSEFISRNDAVTYVVYALGIDIHHCYESYGAVKPIYCDYLHLTFDGNEYYEFFNNTNLHFNWKGDQIMTAFKDLGICFGYGECQQHVGDYILQPLKAVTLNETLAFMVRALMPQSQELFDLNYIVNIAKEKGLIVETDSFFDDLENPVTFDEFRLILGRFMSQKVSLGGYCETYAPSDLSYFARYDDMDITYYQLLEEKYGKGYAERILDLKGYDWLESYIRDNYETIYTAKNDEDVA